MTPELPRFLAVIDLDYCIARDASFDVLLDRLEGREAIIWLRGAGWEQDHVRTIVDRALHGSTWRLVCSDVSLAQRLGCGAHISWQHASVSRARACLRAGVLVGASCHDEHEVAEAHAQGAHYVTISSVYPPISKRPARPVMGLDMLRTFVAHHDIPIFALGGVTPTRTREVREAGAWGVASMGDFTTATTDDVVTAFYDALEADR